MYQAVLRGELTRELGVAWTSVRDGIAEVEGVPSSVIRAFSRRRAQIEAALAERGVEGARAAESAALATRQQKSASLDGATVERQWSERATQLGFGAGAVSRLRGQARSRPLDDVGLAALRTELAGRRGRTYRRSSFGRRDVLLELCERLPAGTSVTARELESAADEFLSSARVVPLVGNRGADAESFRSSNGRKLPVAVDERRYSTPELLALEQRLVDRVRHSPHRAPTAGRAAAAAIATRPSLSAEQREMVRRLCERDELGAVVSGKAGTGKTYALGAAREAWENAGYPVRGVAVARRAACELRDGAGIESTSVAAAARRSGAAEEHDLVVDEAGMTGTRQLSALLERVISAHGKLVLVGDHRQLAELEAGGVFRGLVHRGLAVELRENVRQVQAWERAALDQLRHGEVEYALEEYAGRGRVITGGDVRQRLVDDWRAHGGGPDETLIIARRRADVADLNARARLVLSEAGELGSEEIVLPGGRFAVGDRVVVKRNAHGVSNGERGRVAAISDRGVVLELANGRVGLDRQFLFEPTDHGEPSLVHGYAITGHVAQGLTTERTFVLADAAGTREWLYVAMSRGRQANRLYVADEDRAREEFAPIDPHRPDAWRRLAAAVTRSEAQSMAIDVGADRQLARRLDLERRIAARHARLGRDDDFGLER